MTLLALHRITLQMGREMDSSAQSGLGPGLSASSDGHQAPGFAYMSLQMFFSTIVSALVSVYRSLWALLITFLSVAHGVPFNSYCSQHRAAAFQSDPKTLATAPYLRSSGLILPARDGR